MRTRAEHMAWARERALEYVDNGDCINALASFASDITKHPETNTEAMTALVALIGPLHRGSPAAMRKFIRDFA